LLDLVPAFRRQINVYTKGANTSDASLAGYLADSVQGLTTMWERDYELTFISPATYTVSPNISAGDIRPIILMASIIYKMGNLAMYNFTDGDFSWSLPRGSDYNPITMDRNELLGYVPVRLAKARAGQLFGYKAIYNPENYDWWEAISWIYY